jgi:Asp-tRNA(Asn)/Glu-tRNA(Gln) amidotransferase A subunit family amidase
MLFSKSMELHTLSLREIVAGVHDRRWSAADVLSACAARIAALEPRVQAWEHLDLDGAAAQAQAMDAAAGKGALHGVPVGIKDIIDVAGMPTRYGSGIHASAPPAPETAECVEALQRAGAVVVGKTVTTEFAYYTPGRTRNPWNPAHTPGGSSMGSAAAVACGMVAGALGTQTNGSVIRPAAFCGVVGFKPSFGTVSNHGTMDPWPTLDHTGVFARDVADAASLAAIITTRGAVSGRIMMPGRAPRLAVVRSPVWHLARCEQQEMLASNAIALTHAGAKVDDLELPPAFDDAHRMHRVILGFEAARFFRELQRSYRDRMSARFNELLDEGAAISEAQHREAVEAAARLRLEFARALAGYDAVLTPPASGEAPATLEETGSPAFCTLWTLLGVPAITIPVGVGPAGLPLGLQIVGHELRDDHVISIGAWCESHLPRAGVNRGRIPIFGTEK